MKQHNRILVVLSMAIVAATSALAQSGELTTIDYPGASSTQTWGINP